MTTIKLTRMELRNFKGVVKADYKFADQTNIVGGNATGKSTIFEAYLWCLFDKNQLGNQTRVQPLDENNEVKHQLNTSVKLYLSIDGNPMIVERTLKENWTKPRGTAEMVLNGTTSEFAINEVPMSKTEFTNKLAEILPLDRWFQISAIGIIPTMDQKTCRAALQEIAPEFDEKALAAKFPAVSEAFSKGIMVDELQAMLKRDKKVAQEDLDSIPAALEAQERLRVDKDFDLIRNEIAEYDKIIKVKEEEIASYANTTVDEQAVAESNKLQANLTEVNRKLTAIHLNAEYDNQNLKKFIDRALSDIEREATTIGLRIESNKKSADAMLQNINNLKAQMDGYREAWKGKNAEEYTKPTIVGICPTCGQPLPESAIWEAEKKAKEDWNTKKQQELKSIEADAATVKERISKLLAENEANKKQMEEDNRTLETLADRTKDFVQKREAIPTIDESLKLNEEYQKLLAEKEAIEQRIKLFAEQHDDAVAKERVADLKAQLKEKMSEREYWIKELAGEKTNERIDEERKRLEGLQQIWADNIAQIEGKEASIAAFRKSKIEAVEDGVSRLFTMVHWKMYEQNVTNDGEKEICQAIIDGVPYEQQNRATQVNAGIDIVNGFAKAYGVNAPLFIDNAESVTEPIQTNGQSIKLTVLPNSPLLFK